MAAATFAVPPSAFGIPITGTSKIRQRQGTWMLIPLAQTAEPVGDADEVTRQPQAGRVWFTLGKSHIITVVPGDGSAYDQHLGDQAQSDYSLLIWRSASPGDTEGDANGCTVEVGSAPSALSLSLTEL